MSTSTTSVSAQDTTPVLREESVALQFDFPQPIDKAVLNTLPLSRYDGPIHLINQDEQVDAAVATLSQATILGFDTETRPSFRRGDNYPVALLQLASDDGVWLFRLNQLDHTGPLADLLANEAVLKVGVAIRDDIRALQKRFEFEPGGFVEISQITTRLKITNTGLRALVGIFLGERVSKSAQVTNWARQELTDAQLHYAANDAWVSRRLYQHLLDHGYV
jgi:ribonuclease D